MVIFWIYLANWKYISIHWYSRLQFNLKFKVLQFTATKYKQICDVFSLDRLTTFQDGIQPERTLPPCLPCSASTHFPERMRRFPLLCPHCDSRKIESPETGSDRRRLEWWRSCQIGTGWPRNRQSCSRTGNDNEGTRGFGPCNLEMHWLLHRSNIHNKFFGLNS